MLRGFNVYSFALKILILKSLAPIDVPSLIIVLRGWAAKVILIFKLKSVDNNNNIVGIYYHNLTYSISTIV